MSRTKSSRPKNFKSLLRSWNSFLLLFLVLEFVIFGTANSKFLRIPLLLSSVNDFIAICLISLFVTFVMITGGIDIQAGAIVGLTSITIGVAWQDFGLNIWAAVLVAIVAAALCGALSGFFIAYCRVQAMVVTLGGSFLYAGVALLISTLSSTESYQGISGFPDSFKALTKFKLFGVIPSQLLIFAAMTLIAYLLLHKSKYGRKVFLVGVNQNAAEFSGINSRLIILSTYILSAISAAVAGIVLTSYLGTAKSDLGSTLTMNIITACVLGGTLSTGGKGSAIGTALAALIIGILRFGLPLCFGVSTQYLDIPIGVLLIVVVVGRAMAQQPKVVAFMARLKQNFSGVRQGAK
ncbi:ABC transporter permease [Anaerotruncus sp.]|jgi:AI-2 transport system permease protein|uniref:ABC transporter permease n=1 Tax=Anaerotruncus TaxID=244127 RepID=UPI002173C26B|nr:MULTISPECIES: ABC transporter permease [Anaerotruncus]MCI8491603.1 ABC transporter permease [Anaerotruncus sp.]